ncbi:SGNH/GDSL hydrolase family protein, partial [Streptomyces sp. 12297]
MRNTTRSGRPLTALGTAAALAAVLVGAVTGCSAGSGEGPGTRADVAGARPPAKAAPVWNRQPSSIAAVGDSITRGFDACSVLADCPEASWATGNDPAVR